MVRCSHTLRLFRRIAMRNLPIDLEIDLGMKFMRAGSMVAMVFMAGNVTAGAQARFDADAVRLNNRGVALMGQQFTEKAEQSFAEAFKKDPKLAQAAINDGIALLTLQKIDEAKKALQAALVLIRAVHRDGTTWGWRSMRTTNWTMR